MPFWRLDAQRFVRVQLSMQDGAKVPCSRRYRAALRERFGRSAAA